MSYRTGKKPAAPRPSDFMLKDVSDTSALPKPPERFGNGTIFAADGSGWKMLANDRLGDCVEAEACHGTMLATRIGKGTAAPFSDPAAIKFYEEAAGYDPSDPSTDQGTDMHNAMSLRRTKGVADDTGKRHLIDAYVSVDAKDFDLMVRCVYTFGMVALGFEFPRSAMQQFDDGKPWDVDQSLDMTIEGGHDVLAVGSVRSSSEVSVVTWGRRQVMTRAFYERFNDETWIPLSFELARNGYGLHHVDEARLRQMLASL